MPASFKALSTLKINNAMISDRLFLFFVNKSTRFERS